MTSNRQKFISLCEKYNIPYGPKEFRNVLDLYSKQPYVGKRCWLIAYKADLSEFIGKEVFFHISDNADSGYGLFFADSFVTYYETEPEGFNEATPVRYEVSGTIYDLFNGSCKR